MDTLLGYCERKTEVVDRLNQYMQPQTPTVIALDAFMTRPNIEWLYIKRGRHKMKVIDNILPQDSNKKVKFMSRDLFTNKIIQDLREGKKLVIASNNKDWISNKILPAVHDLIKELREEAEAK